MVAARKKTEPLQTVGSPATTPEARENQLVSLAYDRAQQQIIEGTASPQVITHFLRLEADREKRALEIVRLQKEVEKLEAQIGQMGYVEAQNELYEKALNAFARYQGSEEEYLD